MADVGIKKVSTSFANLPDINSQLGGYICRYRIVSEDKNRVSQWSPIFVIQPNYIFVPGTLSVEPGVQTVGFVWNAVGIKTAADNEIFANVSAYDVWVRWHNDDNGDWAYVDRISNIAATIQIPSDYQIGGIDQGTSPTKLDVEVYVRGFPIERGDGVPLAPGTPFLKVYESTDNVIVSS